MPKKTFVVEGTGDFPFDMLRYDACWPSSGEDAGEMVNPREYEEKIRRRSVTLSSNSPSAPTHGRWASFLWHVKEVK